MFRQSPTFQVYTKGMAQQNALRSSTEHGLALKVNAIGSYERVFNEIDPNGNLNKSTAMTQSLGLSYTFLNSLETSLNTQYLGNRYIALSPQNTHTYAFSLKSAYNLSNGGQNASLNIQNKLERLQSELGYLDTQSNLLQNFLSFSQTILDLFSNLCKYNLTKDILGTIDQTVLKGKLLLETGHISQKDHLNFLQLKTNYQQTLQSIERDTALLFQTLTLYSPHLIQKVKALFSVQMCDTSNITNNKKDDHVRQIKSLSAHQSIDALRSKKNLELSEMLLRQTLRKNVLNIKPFIEASLLRNEFEQDMDQSLMGGIDFQWDLPNTRWSHEKNSGRLLTEQSRQQVLEKNLLSQSQIVSFEININQTNKLLMLLIEDLKNVDALIKQLGLERGVSNIDPLNYSNAYLRKISVLSSIFDAMADFDKTLVNVQYFNQFDQIQ